MLHHTDSSMLHDIQVHLLTIKKREDREKIYSLLPIGGIGHFGDLTFHYDSQSREKAKKNIPTKKKTVTTHSLLFFVSKGKKRLICF